MRCLILALLLAASAVFAASSAQADSMSFGVFGDAVSDDITGQLSVEIVQVDSTVCFTFRNDGSIASSITDVYFASALGAYLDLTSGVITDSDDTVSGSQVDFSVGAHPGSVPNGDTWSWTGTGYSMDSDSPTYHDGVNAGLGEWVKVTFALGTYDPGDGSSVAYSLAHLRGLMTDGTLTGQGTGLHVQGIGTSDDSGWYGIVPEPTSIALLGFGLAGLAGIRRRRRKA